MAEHKSKYDGVILEFVEAKIENPRLPIKDFCKRQNVNYEAFFRVLKKDPKHMESILNGIRKRYHEMSIEVDLALYDKARNGDPRAIDLWYKRIEGWNIQNPHEGNKIIIVFPEGLVPPGILSPENEPIRRIEMKTGRNEIIGDEEEEEEEESCFEVEV